MQHLHPLHKALRNVPLHQPAKRVERRDIFFNSHSLPPPNRCWWWSSSSTTTATPPPPPPPPLSTTLAPSQQPQINNSLPFSPTPFNNWSDRSSSSPSSSPRYYLPLITHIISRINIIIPTTTIISPSKSYPYANNNNNNNNNNIPQKTKIVHYNHSPPTFSP